MEGNQPISGNHNEEQLTQSSPFVICDNLVKIYKVADLEVVALQGLDLAVSPGELLAIVGPSGSGKSSLLNILGGLELPSAGRVWVDGENLLKYSASDLDRYRRTKVGFIWQQSARNLIPYLTAQENVELPMMIAGRGGTERRERAQGILDIIGLTERKQHRLTELSGGEQQRVAIAVALANNPLLLLGDEPTGEVDEATAKVIYQTFKDLNREFGLTTIIVSHDPDIAHHVDRVVAIRDGKTAIETIRQSGAKASRESGKAEHVVLEDEIFQEFTVLDAAGRLQLPEDHLKHFGIKRRVHLEITPEGILIRPAQEQGDVQVLEPVTENAVQRRSLQNIFSVVQSWAVKIFQRKSKNDGQG